MKFQITFNHIDGEWEKLSQAEREQHGATLRDFVRALKVEKDAEMVFLAPKEGAKTVRIHSDQRLEILDGPTLPGPEAAGGYFIIDADSIDEAVEWAKKGRFLVGSNEVRQIVDFQP